MQIIQSYSALVVCGFAVFSLFHRASVPPWLARKEAGCGQAGPAFLFLAPPLSCEPAALHTAQGMLLNAVESHFSFLGNPNQKLTGVSAAHKSEPAYGLCLALDLEKDN